MVNGNLRTVLVLLILLTSLFFLKSGVVNVARAQPCVTPPSGMVAWWPLDETSGTTVTDIVGGHNGVPRPGPIGTFSGTGPVSSSQWPPPTFLPGMVGNSLFFYGNRYVNVTTNSALEPGTGNFTIDAWVIYAAGGIVPLLTIARKAVGNAGTPTTATLAPGEIGYELTIQDSSPIGFLRMAMQGAGLGNLGMAGPNITPNTWHHVAFTLQRTSAAATATFYLDGYMSSPLTTLWTYGNVANTWDLLIGGDGVKAGEIAVDEVEIFNRALPASDIYSIWHAGSAGKCSTPKLTCVNGTIDLSTGTTNPFVADPALTPDPHWVITNLPSGPVSQHPYSVIPPSTGWYHISPVGPVGPWATANWISPSNSSGSVGPPGNYNYSITFTVPGTSTLQIFGYAADNNVWLYLDNNPIPGAFDSSATGTAFTNLHTPITLTVPGPATHVLSAGVDNNHPSNGSSPTGLLVIANVTCCKAIVTQITTITSPGSTSTSYTTSTVPGATVTMTSTYYSTATQWLATTATTTMTSTSYTTQTVSGIAMGMTQITSTTTTTIGTPMTITQTTTWTTTTTGAGHPQVVTITSTTTQTIKTSTTVTDTKTMTVRTNIFYTNTATYSSLTTSTSTVTGVYPTTSTYTSTTTVTSTFGSSTITSTTTIVLPGSTTTSTATTTTTCTGTTTTTSPSRPTTVTATTITTWNTEGTSSTTTSPSRACIIAQAAYGSDLAPDVQLLRTCRDQRLLSTFAGSQFMQIFNRFYYSFSPQVAEVVASNTLLADMTRILLAPLIQILKITMLLPRTEIEVTACGLLAAALIGATYLTPPIVILRAFAKRASILQNWLEMVFNTSFSHLEVWVRSTSSSWSL